MEDGQKPQPLYPVTLGLVAKVSVSVTFSESTFKVVKEPVSLWSHTKAGRTGHNPTFDGENTVLFALITYSLTV